MARFCRWMYDIQKLINAKSLLEVDGFFNYIYWKIKKKKIMPKDQDTIFD